jgi:hypothetical protein
MSHGSQTLWPVLISKDSLLNASTSTRDSNSFKQPPVLNKLSMKNLAASLAANFLVPAQGMMRLSFERNN